MVEAHAETLKVVHAYRSFGAEHLGGSATNKAPPGVLGIAAVREGTVVVGERGGQTALRPIARGFGERGRRNQGDARTIGCGAQRRVQTRSAGADYGELSLNGSGGCHRAKRIAIASSVIVSEPPRADHAAEATPELVCGSSPTNVTATQIGQRTLVIESSREVAMCAGGVRRG